MANVQILIVEGKNILLKDLQSPLKDLGYTVLAVASSGEEAIQKATQMHPDLVLIDRDLKGKIDGEEIAQRIHTHLDIPVVYLTTSVEDYLLQHGDTAELFDYVRKPFEETDLHKTIEMALYRHKMERKLKEKEQHIGKLSKIIATLKEYVIKYKQVKEHLGKLSRAIEQSPGVVILINTTGSIEYVNSRFVEISGYAAKEVMGINLRDLSVQPVEVYQQMWETVTSGGEWRGEFPCKKKNSEHYWELTSISPIRNQKGLITHFLAVRDDVTQRKRDEEKIRYLAYYDALTGLPNRTLFNDRLNLALAHAHRNQQRVAVMFLDLDRFRTINDTLGHTLGDRLLQGVAGRLERCVREGDTVARLGGDDFMLLLPGINQVEEAFKIAERILQSLEPVFKVDDQELHISASIGIALYPNDGENAQTLLKNAGTALSRAKVQGKNNYQSYTATMDVKSLERLMLEQGLRRALEREEFVIHYQPQVDLSFGQIVGIEALVRWQHPHLGLVSPMKFIPLAEETGLIVSLGEWVLRTACSQNKALQDAGFPPLRIAVNLSASHFRQKDLIKTIAKILEETRLDPNYLELELTESTVMESAETTIAMLRRLKEMGVHLSIDDFGTGYSSLSYLKRFPIDTLKIDRSFVRDITTDLDDAEIAKLIIAMAHSLKLKVVAEGVETKEQFEFLRSQQCDEMQGYYFSPPLPVEAFFQLLNKTPVKSIGIKHLRVN